MDRRRFLASTTAAAAASIALSAPAIASGAIVWRLATMWPRASGRHKQIEGFAALVESMSAGRLEIAVSAGGEVAPPQKLMSLVSAGSIEMGHTIPLLWVRQEPAAAMLIYFPFGLTLPEKDAWYEFGGGQALADKIYGRMGCKFLVMGGSDNQMGGWFVPEIGGVADLGGVRMRIGGVVGEIMAALGVVPVGLPIIGGKVQAAFEAGEIDAAEMVGPAFDLRAGFHRYARNYYYPNWHETAANLDLFINREKWDALPPDLKAVVETAAAATHKRMLGASLAANAKALKTLVNEHDVVLKRFPAEVMAALARATAEIAPARAAQDALSQEVYHSMTGFRDRVHDWAAVTYQPYLEARGAA